LSQTCPINPCRLLDTCEPLPSLRRDRDRAEDLVHETVVRALSNRDRFERGTDSKAWLLTILRNLYRTESRRRGREVEAGEGHFAARLTSIPEQMGPRAFRDLEAALQKLAPHRREVLILGGAQGLSSEEAAAVCGCPVGTIGSGRAGQGRSWGTSWVRPLPRRLGRTASPPRRCTRLHGLPLLLPHRPSLSA
jgi:RNA polymerase sigma-70 factor (ECF subfamily)